MSKYQIKIYDKEGNLKKIVASKTDEEILAAKELPSDRNAMGMLRTSAARGANSGGAGAIKKNWTKEEDHIIIENIKSDSPKTLYELSKILNVGCNSIYIRQKILKKMLNGNHGLYVNRHVSRLDKNNEEMMNDLKNLFNTQKMLSKKYGVARSTIGGWRLKLGIKW